MNEKMTILEVSACGNRQAEKKLRFHGDMDARIIFMMQKLLQKEKWNLISIRDIPWHSLQKLERELGRLGYKMYMHESWQDVKEKWRYTCLSALFVSEGIEFSQKHTSDKFESILRYVYGKFYFEGEEIVYKTSHIPCVDDSRSNLIHQIERKTSMLEDELIFQEENKNNLAISAGDFNGDPFSRCGYAQELYEQFPFIDTVSGDTYEDKTLDHVYISERLRDSDIKVTTEIIDDYYMQLTDHKIIAITLSK